MIPTVTPTATQLADQLEQDIRQRNLQPGTDYGSTAEIARKHGVSLDVARRALRMLARRKIVESRRGTGHLIADPATAVPPGPARRSLAERVAELERWRAEQEGR